MPAVRWAAAARVAACLGAIAGLAGCSTTSSSSSASTVTVTGSTLTVVISQPPGAATNPVAQAVLNAEQAAFGVEKGAAERHFHLQMAVIRGGELSAHARTAIALDAQSAIAYLGEIAPGSSEQSVGITNAEDLPQISPTDTALELTQATSAVAGAPNLFYESYSTYGRTFLRVAPSSALEAKVQVQEMKTLGVSSLAVESDGSDYGRAVAQAVRGDAKGAGITLSSGASGAGAVFVGAASPATGARLLDAAATAAPVAKLFGTSSLDTPAFLSAVSPAAARRLLISTPQIPVSDLPAAGQSFVKSLRGSGPAAVQAGGLGYAAMSVVLKAITEAGASANDRATVLRRLRSIHLGGLSFSSSGASNLTAFGFNRVRDGALVPATGVAAGG